jgi:hypothetical protein
MAEQRIQRRLVAIFASDIVGYSRRQKTIRKKGAMQWRSESFSNFPA